MSPQILLPDLWKVYAQLSDGQVLQLPGKSSSFKAWAGGQ
jgi:hypothetical protein